MRDGSGSSLRPVRTRTTHQPLIYMLDELYSTRKFNELSPKYSKSVKRANQLELQDDRLERVTKFWSYPTSISVIVSSTSYIIP